MSKTAKYPTLTKEHLKNLLTSITNQAPVSGSTLAALCDDIYGPGKWPKANLWVAEWIGEGKVVFDRDFKMRMVKGEANAR